MAQEIVINSNYGGFSLSMQATKRLAELNGRDCYFFSLEVSSGRYHYVPIKCMPTKNAPIMWSAFDVDDVDMLNSFDGDNTKEGREREREWYAKHSLESRPEDRADKLLIQVVKELGEKANAKFSNLKVVEIPDGVEWQIEEYDGSEWISEKHRVWS